MLVCGGDIGKMVSVTCIDLYSTVSMQGQRVYDRNHYFMDFISSHAHIPYAIPFFSIQHFAAKPCGCLFDHTDFGRCSMSHEHNFGQLQKRFIKNLVAFFSRWCAFFSFSSHIFHQLADSNQKVVLTIKMECESHLNFIRIYFTQRVYQWFLGNQRTF